MGRTLALLLLVAATARAAVCPPDAALSGGLCVDRWEASLWAVPSSDDALLAAMRAGETDAAALQAAGAIQIGCGGARFGLAPMRAAEGRLLVAQSLPGVRPSTCVTWEQASRACAEAGKRLLRIGEWYAAATGTPRPACNLSGPPFDVAATGERVGCVSRSGVYDLPGNVEEWVDPAPLAPGAHLRTGRAWYADAVDVQHMATRPLSPTTGFRCARDP